MGMRVLILSNMYPSEELPFAGVFVRNQVEILQEEAGPTCDIDLSAMRRRFTGKLGSLLKYSRFALNCLPRLFRRYDIVHVHYFVPLGLIGAIYKILHPASRIVVTFHGGDVRPAKFRGIRGRLWRVVSSRMDYGIAVGPGVAEAVENNLAVRKLDVLPAGVDSRKFYQAGSTAVEERYDFVFAGSFSHRKGIDLIVNALRDSRLSTARLAFVGTGPMRNLIESIVGVEDVRIFDHLTQDRLREVFWASKFLVLPSRSEPFGLVVSEAMYCGTPVIVSSEPGPMSQVIHGRNGIVFDTGSVDGLCMAMDAALAMSDIEYKRMASEAAQSNRQFDIYEVTRALLKEYRSLCAV
ncbi:MAG: glycosyltransferase family 4 protein [Gammaproteobacteria bacterium]|nr:glycosyltransferase family 4 protein [Gammaproteobacteria bacterium]